VGSGSLNTTAVELKSYARCFAPNDICVIPFQPEGRGSVAQHNLFLYLWLNASFDAVGACGMYQEKSQKNDRFAIHGYDKCKQDV
jgi:hypothetical protein